MNSKIIIGIAIVIILIGIAVFSLSMDPLSIDINNQENIQTEGKHVVLELTDSVAMSSP